MPKSKETILHQCVNNVKKHDYENFLASLMLPSRLRNAAFVIRAFNIEIAQINDITKEELIARMRYQYWYEILNQMYEKKSVPNHPVAKCFFMLKEKRNLSKLWVKNLIESREDYLVNPLASIEDLELCAEKSNSSLYYLILQSAGISDIQADHYASHLGKSEGIVKLIRGVPHFSNKRKVFIPKSLLVNHKLSEESLIQGREPEKVKEVIFELASTANQHLTHAKKLEKDVSKDARLIFLPSVIISSYLKQLERKNFDVFHPTFRKRNPFLPFKLIAARLRI